MLIIGFEVNTYCATQLNDLNELATWIIFVYMQTIVFCMGIGLSVGIRSLVSQTVSVEGNAKAKSMTKVYFLYSMTISVVIMIFILMFGN